MRGIASIAGILLAAGLAAPALADEPRPGTVALSPAERAAVLDAAAKGGESDLSAGMPDRKPHGMMGVEVSSRGGTALYGTTVMPIGDNAMVGFSFLTANSGRLRGR